MTIRNMNGQEIPEWPPAARHIITGISKADREEFDQWRCGPAIKDEEDSSGSLAGWIWCNYGSGWAGHCYNGEVTPNMICCPICGVEV